MELTVDLLIEDRDQKEYGWTNKVLTKLGKELFEKSIEVDTTPYKDWIFLKLPK